MNQKHLLAFIQRIIETSPDQYAAAQALDQLKAILETDLNAADLAQLSTARTGVSDDFIDMRSQLRDPSMDANALEIAAARARQHRIQREEDARNGRC